VSADKPCKSILVFFETPIFWKEKKPIKHSVLYHSGAMHMLYKHDRLLYP
jgi:hypothetical protein